VTLSGFAGGEYLPLPASKGPAFPFPLTLDGYPTFPANFAQGQGVSPKIEEGSELVFPVFQEFPILPFDGLLPISLERTLKNFWESFLVKRNGYKSRV